MKKIFLIIILINKEIEVKVVVETKIQNFAKLINNVINLPINILHILFKGYC